MFAYLLEETEQVIYQLAYLFQQKPTFSFEQIAHELEKNTRSIERHLTLWLTNEQNAGYFPVIIQQKNCFLADYFFQPISLILFLYQENETFQILAYLLDFPYCSIEELEQAFFCSRSTIKRRINKLKLFLSAFQLNLSFQYKPILSGSEFNLRLLALIVDLINDPPFDFHSKEELIQRIESIQEKRISVGCSFNQLPFAQLFAKEEQTNYQLSERGWLFFWQQLLKKEPLKIIEQLANYLPFFTPEELTTWLQLFMTATPYTSASFFIAETSDG